MLCRIYGETTMINETWCVAVITMTNIVFTIKIILITKTNTVITMNILVITKKFIVHLDYVISQIKNLIDYILILGNITLLMNLHFTPH